MGAAKNSMKERWMRLHRSSAILEAYSISITRVSWESTLWIWTQGPPNQLLPTKSEPIGNVGSESWTAVVGKGRKNEYGLPAI